MTVCLVACLRLLLFACLTLRLLLFVFWVCAGLCLFVFDGSACFCSIVLFVLGFACLLLFVLVCFCLLLVLLVFVCLFLLLGLFDFIVFLLVGLIDLIGVLLFCLCLFV